MKKRNIVLLMIIAIAFVIFALGCSKSEKTEQTQVSAEQTYICPMHPEVTSNEPGLCPECNMKLVPKDATEDEMMEHHMDSTKLVYTCPMHPEVVSDEPGLCPDCNMNLEPKEAEANEPDEHGMIMEESVPVQYTCGMHPQIVTNEPGLCPICNMKLVVKSGVSSESGAIMVNAKTSKQMGIATTVATYRPLTKSIRVYGNITYSEPNVFKINLKTPGWVEKLYVNETGMKVKKGQTLLEIYSPELVAAQQEYLIALKTTKSLQSGETAPNKLVDAAYRRLRNWDISDEQINKLVATKNPTRTLKLLSPFDGVVTFKNVNEGDHIMPGRYLYNIANLSTVWVTAFVFEQDLNNVSEGLNASVSSPSLPGETFDSKIIYVSPFLDESRQAEIRLEVPNDKMQLKPNMYAEVNIKKSIGDQNLSVPRSAIIKSGTREILFVAKDKNMFEPREVHTGLIADNEYVQILHGLDKGEAVVTSGQFMLDSESRLNETIAGMTHSH